MLFKKASGKNPQKLFVVDHNGQWRLFHPAQRDIGTKVSQNVPIQLLLEDRSRLLFERGHALPLPADDHRLGGAVTARAGRSLNVRGCSAGAIGAGQDLVGAARRFRRVTDYPEARASCLRTRRARRTNRPGRTLRALSPAGPWSPLSPLSPLAQPERVTSTAMATPATKMRIMLLRDPANGAPGKQ